MKRKLQLLYVLLIMAIPLSLFSQNAVIILEYMKVDPAHTQDYLAIEQEWKKIHEKRIEAGIITGWQLWRKMFSGADDPYQFITINWFDGYAKTFDRNSPGDSEDLFSEQEWNALFERTINSRTLVSTSVARRVLEAEGSHGGKYIVINHMDVKPGMEGAYYGIENDIWKPYQEAAIKKDVKANWGVWARWPYKEGESLYQSVDGYDSPEQMMRNADILEEVHPGMTWEEIDKKTAETRSISSVEMWELVDAVFPE